MNLKDYLSGLPRGGASKLADELGISMSYLSQLASGAAPVSPERAVQIEQKTGGEVTRKDTHPNNWRLIWPELGNSPSGALTPQAEPHHISG